LEGLFLKRIQGYWEKYFPYLLTAIFLTLSIVLAFRHEIWNDAAAAWNLSIDSSAIQEFITNMRGDSYGHPYLWNAILYFISHYITSNVESMKAVHLAISTTTVFLFLKYAPFNKIIKTLFVFGYFPFFEYSIISRNYAIGVLPIIIFCILYKNKYKNIILIAVTLFFMGHAHVFTFVISMIFVLMIIIDFIIDRKIAAQKINKIYLGIAFVIVVAEILSLYWHLGSLATQGSAFAPTIFTMFDKTFEQYRQSAYLISKGIISAVIPIPDITINFWWGNLINTFLSKFNFIYTFIFSLILIIIPIFIIKRRTIFLYVFGSICILALPFVGIGGELRQFGFLFIFLIACLWISNISNRGGEYLIKYRGNQNKIFLNTFLIVILSLSIVGSSVASYFDFRYPFSSGKQVAEYIDENFDKDNIVMVGYKDADVQTVMAYMNKGMYLPQFGQFGRFCEWSKRANEVDTEEIFKKAISFINKDSKILTVIHCNAIKDSKVPQKYLFNKIDVEFDDSVVGYENFCLYIFDKSKITPILDFASYRNAEFQNMKLSEDKREIIIEEGREKLKLCKIPIKVSSNKDYLVSFEIRRTKGLEYPISFDFIGDDYDNPEQEFVLNPDYVGADYTQIIQIINSNEIPSNIGVYFRIFTYSEEEVIIRNLEVYEVEYSAY
jgi:hypothetical protein